jgi:hypothetical protein
MFLGSVAQKILQSSEHKRTESSASSISTLKQMTFKHHNKKTLGQILSFGNRMSLLADESKNRTPINFAKLRKRFAQLSLVASCIRARKNDAPPRGYESMGTLPTFGRGFWIHSRRPS